MFIKRFQMRFKVFLILIFFDLLTKGIVIVDFRLVVLEVKIIDFFVVILGLKAKVVNLVEKIDNIDWVGIVRVAEFITVDITEVDKIFAVVVKG